MNTAIVNTGSRASPSDHAIRHVHKMYNLFSCNACRLVFDKAKLLVLFDKCNFYMIFIILLFIKIVSFPLFLLI